VLIQPVFLLHQVDQGCQWLVATIRVVTLAKTDPEEQAAVIW
jgi:hypothetical protein